MLLLKWFTSGAVRQAWQAANHVEKILDHQRDLLTPAAIVSVQAALDDLRGTCRTGDKGAIRTSLNKLEKAANANLKSYPHATWRENTEVALVAIAVAMGIRTFVLQPFKIPTGSMQPTLYGVTYEDLRNQPDVKIPGAFRSLLEYWFCGVQYFHIVAPASGTLTYEPPTKMVLFNARQSYSIGGERSGVMFPPDDLFQRAGLFQGTAVQAGDELLKMRVIAGDHLFVDRLTYNFRRPARGDVVVFETHGITRLDAGQQDTYYIKRLCGLGGEHLTLRTNGMVLHNRYGTPLVGHLLVNGTNEITGATPHFENLYSFTDLVAARSLQARARQELPQANFHENHYYGHALMEGLAPGMEYTVPPHHYFVMGDNTFNSSDSRYWGDFDESKVIGKSFFVYWPIGGTTFNGEPRPSRFGWAQR